jgi:hypothetical protein
VVVGLAAVAVLVTAVLVAGHHREPVSASVSASASPTVRSVTVPTASPAVDLAFTDPVATSGPVTAAELLSASLAAATAAGSVHVAVTNLADGTETTFAMDVDARGGTQDVTRGGGTASIVVVEDTAYVSAEAVPLQDLFGLDESAAAANAGHWVAVPRGDELFEVVSTGISLPSVLAGLQLGGALTVEPRRDLDGRAVVGVTGALSGSAWPDGTTGTLWRGADDQRPYRLEARTADGATSTSTYTAWGAPVVSSVPVGAVPLAR